jgi:hypothetical protein
LLETAKIVDPRAAAVFASPRQRKLLLALVDEERSLSQLARLTDTPLNLVHYHLRKFLSLRLAGMVRQERRAGAPIKYYRANARSFFVPADLMVAEPGDGLESRLRAQLARNRARTLQGVVYSHDEKGPRMRLVSDQHPRRMATELWMELHLSESDAACLAEELRALFRRFEARSRKPHRRHLIHAAVAAM